MDIKDQKILVLSIDHYKVNDEETGEINEGTTVWYYSNSELEPVKSNDDSYGIKPAKFSLPADYLVGSINCKVPCIALVDFKMRPDSKGKMQLTPVNFRPAFDDSIKIVTESVKAAAK